ncbi:hypothetical protein V6N11_043184 [Hibiscus sabdariffa]|uniref:Programmed cell death protein 2 C-terminal domain-containing protein n=1 Tax=Hibiscus sabdariffa TaxID=183260 RepID=A0ABR2QYM9_9ROSI
MSTYCRSVGSKPLWPILGGRPCRADIPLCSYCGGRLCFEFQILPQLLYFFGVKNDADSLDWATISVYTCEASCEGVGVEESYNSKNVFFSRASWFASYLGIRTDAFENSYIKNWISSWINMKEGHSAGNGKTVCVHYVVHTDGTSSPKHFCSLAESKESHMFM